MNPTPPNNGDTGTPAATTKAQVAAFNEVKEYIDECPEECLIELFKQHTGTDFIPELVTADIDGSLSALEQMASFGNKRAIEGLAAISTQIARFLDQMAGSPDDKIQQNVDKGKFTHRDLDQTRSWRRDYRKISKALRVLVNIPVSVQDNLIKTLDQKRPSNFMLPDAIGMFTRRLQHIAHSPTHSDPNLSPHRDPLGEGAELRWLDPILAKPLEYLAHHRAQYLAREATRQVAADPETRSVSGSPQDPLEEGAELRRLEQMLARLLENYAQRLEREATRQVTVDTETRPVEGSPQDPLEDGAELRRLDLMLARLLEYRAQHLAREAARQVIAKAETWPIAVPALEDGRSEGIERRLSVIGLGSEIGYDLTGTARGRKREITSKSGTGMVYQIFLQLVQERNAAQQMSPSHLKTYDDYDKNKILPSLGANTQEDANLLKLREFRTWNSQNHWERKAALLPPPLIEHLDSWAEAAVAYQRAITAKKFYASTIGRQLKSASNESGTQNSLLYFRICRGCNNPVDDAQCDTCKAYKKAILERIGTAQSIELNLRETLEKRVETEFDVGQKRQEMKNGLKVILGRP